ncbi:MAG: DNA alkylation repair protein, partial [Myxococcales bacterium]|nr:DNA alkylation repair protein [Myxococcales bacterium]
SVDTLGPAAIDAELARLEREMPDAPFLVKEGMNFCLVQLGTKIPSVTERAMEIGARMGVWDLRPIPKGCTSAYAPEWIAVLLARSSPAWKARAAEAVAVRDAALAAAKAAARKAAPSAKAKKSRAKG